MCKCSYIASQSSLFSAGVVFVCAKQAVFANTSTNVLAIHVAFAFSKLLRLGVLLVNFPQRVLLNIKQCSMSCIFQVKLQILLRVCASQRGAGKTVGNISERIIIMLILLQAERRR